MKKIILSIVLIALVVGGAFAFIKYQQLFKPNVPAELDSAFLTIPTGSSFEELSDKLLQEGFVIDENAFLAAAELMKFDKVRSGRYKISPNWTNRKLIQHLRAGAQATVKMVVNTGREYTDVIGKSSTFIESDSLELLDYISNPNNLLDLGYTKETLMSLFIPNTYDIYWNTTPKAFFSKMKKEHDKFWESKGRLAKAKAMDLTPAQVYTLASIVEKESNHKPERPTIAGVYLNRIKKGIPLQADPTVVFATRDFGARRVLNKHLEVDSPYNTYKHAGLPPGPISIASITSIDAVLNPQSHKYLYFCAKPDNSGQHAFAKSLAGHNVNANKFRSWLNKRGVRR